jgi:hypothetical protein
MDLQTALTGILQGLGLLGNGIVYVIKFIFGIFGFDIPDWAISIATIVVLLLTVLAIGSKLNKIVLIILVFLAISTGTGLLTGLLHIGS